MPKLPPFRLPSLVKNATDKLNFSASGVGSDMPTLLKSPLAQYESSNQAQEPGSLQKSPSSAHLLSSRRNPLEQDYGPDMSVLLHVALCHSIIIDKRTGKMNSASPDELALVEGAKQQGYIFEGKDYEGVITIRQGHQQNPLRFQLLNTLEFDSVRKRMSVIVRDLQYDTLMLLCKGADSVIKQRLNLEDFQNNAFMSATQIKVDSFANEGLRTLLLASKPLDELFYNQWNVKFQAALGEVIGKDTKIEQLQEEIET